MTLAASWLDDFFLNEVTTPLTNTGTGALPNVESLTLGGQKVSAIYFEGVAPDVSGIGGGTPGRRIHMIASGGPLIVEDESSLSLAANRIRTGTGAPVEVPQYGAIWLVLL